MRAFTALVNPISGGGKAAERWAGLGAHITAAGADVRVEFTRSAEHAVELAAGAASEGRTVVAVGGDGLVRDVANGVAGTGASMAIVPAGRGNDLARSLGVPTDVDGLTRYLLYGQAKPTDVIEAGTTIVPGNVYAGIDSVANELINASRWLPGILAYRLAPLRAIATWRTPTFTLTTDGSTRVVRAHSIVIANSGAYGHGLRIVPSARVDDGLLHVLIVGDGPRSAIAAFMRAAKQGTHVERPEVDVLTAREVSIDADRPLPLYADGDLLHTLPGTVRVRPAHLSLIRP